jgi:hypothetical protein
MGFAPGANVNARRVENRAMDVTNFIGAMIVIVLGGFVLYAVLRQAIADGMSDHDARRK